MSIQEKTQKIINELEEVSNNFWEIEKKYVQCLLDMTRQVEEANAVITDFLLTHDHADFCPAKISGKTVYCTCMNIGYYNDKKNIERAKAYTEKWSVE